jgi:hypothetical protein
MNVLSNTERVDFGGKRYSLGDQLRLGMLNRHQRAAVLHGMDLHQTVPAWKDKWIHVEDKDGKFECAYRSKDPKELGIPSDLPPIAIQWKQDYTTRFGGKNNV